MLVDDGHQPAEHGDGSLVLPMAAAPNSEPNWRLGKWNRLELG